MKEIKEEKSKLLYNGNFGCRRDSKMPEGIKEVDVLFNGEVVTGLTNESEDYVTLKCGYSTRANGSCQDLVLAPVETIIQKSTGSPHWFASYLVG